MSKAQYTMQDPTQQYPKPAMPKQSQEGPGLAEEMEPKPDHGESSYRGSGRLEGRKSLAQQVAEKGRRVNVVAPGPVWTPLQVAGGQPTEALEEFGSTAALGRPGQPAEMAPAFVFLASQESSYVSGATLAATGGMPTP